ncbi:hypothetical protein [Bacillus cereus group sp. BfR-BA-01524]|uniref:hypothetical protein n=1 Tax=Bacillus cereus group sp. BfR-BA-01524 TaxID=2920372 RepID=UPI001F5AF65F
MINKNRMGMILATTMLAGGALFSSNLTTPVAAQGIAAKISNAPSDYIELDPEFSRAQSIVVNSSFNKGNDGWIGGFADYPVEDEAIYYLKFSNKYLPKEIKNKKSGLFISGVNRSDDLFMFTKKKLDEKVKLKPNTTYSLNFDFDIATNANKNEFGVGGAPGEAVHVKVGATTKEPLPQLDNLRYYRMNIDKGNQAIEGKDAFNVGNLAKVSDSNNEKYELKSFDNKKRPFVVKTDERAELWLFIGTDSGFESKTSIYIPRIKVTLNEIK